MQLTGNIEDLGMGEIFQILSFSGKSGVLRLRNNKMEGSVVFRDGSVIKAACSALKEGVGEALLREGAIGPAELEEARDAQKKGAYAATLGEILLREGKVSAERLDAVAVRLIEKAVYPFFLWQDGYFVFELGEYAQTPEAISADSLQYTLGRGLNAQGLAMEGMRLSDESGPSQDLELATPAAQPSGALQQNGLSATAGAAEQGRPAQENPEDIRYYIRDLLREIGDEGYFPKDSGEAVRSVPNSKGIMVLKEMLEELARPLSLSEIVLLILRFSSEIVGRSVLFTVKDGYFVGCGQSGIEIEGEAADEKVRKIRIPASGPSILSEAVVRKGIVIKEVERTEWNEYLIGQLGSHRPVEAFAAPIIMHGRVEMVLYGDNVPEPCRLDDISTLEIFLGQTNLAMERMG